MSGIRVGLTSKLAHEETSLVVREPEPFHLTLLSAEFCRGNRWFIVFFTEIFAILILIFCDDFIAINVVLVAIEVIMWRGRR